MAFMRMRSPSSAPPDLRRDGSIEITAMFSASPWSRRMRRISSSVSEDLPAPPVPVMPSVGTAGLGGGQQFGAQRGAALSFQRGDQLRQRAVAAAMSPSRSGASEVGA
jgi:hypothetical protein